MKVCIPTMDDKGMAGLPSGHFGSAPFFTFADTETGEVEAVQNGGADHAHGQCQPLAFMGTRPVDAVLCQGIGRGAFTRLQAGGIQVFITRERSVQDALAALEKGTLEMMGPDGLCQGHGHGHEHGGHCHSHHHEHHHGGQGHGEGGGGGRWQ